MSDKYTNHQERYRDITYLWSCSNNFIWKPKAPIKIKGSNNYSIFSTFCELQKVTENWRKLLHFLSVGHNRHV